MIDLETLRTSFRRSSVGNGGGHPSDDQWERLACDELIGDERQRLLDHIIGCSRCSDTYRALEIVRSEAWSFDNSAPAPRAIGTAENVVARPAWWRGLGVLAMAAAVVVAIVLPLRRSNGPLVAPTETVRSGDAETAPRPVAPVESVVEWRSGDDLVLSWHTGDTEWPAAVEVLDADGEPVWTSPDTTASETRWPGDSIPGPGRYYWRVLVRDPTGAQTGSTLTAFEIVSASRR